MNALSRRSAPGPIGPQRFESALGQVTASGPAVLTLAEVAKDLRSSKAHVCNIIAGRVRGLAPLAVLRLGRRILVRRSTLEEWKTQCEQAF